MRKRIAIYLTIILLISLFPFPLNSPNIASAAPPEQMLLKIIDVAYFDIWKHSDGTWQDTNGDRYPDAPWGQYEEWGNTYYLPSWVVQQYKITRIDVKKGISYEDFSDSITIGWPKDQYGNNYDAFFLDYLRYTPDQYSVGGGPLPNNAIDFIYSLTLAPKERARNIKEPWQGPNVEGWRWYIPWTITVYGYRKANVTIQKVEVTDQNGTLMAEVTRGSTPIVHQPVRADKVYNVKVTLTTSELPGAQLVNLDVRGTEAKLGGANPVEIGRGTIPSMVFPDQKEVTFQWRPLDNASKTLTVYYNGAENDPNGDLNSDRTDDWLYIDFVLDQINLAVNYINAEPSPAQQNSSVSIQVGGQNYSNVGIDTVLVVRANGQEIARQLVSLPAYQARDYVFTWVPTTTGQVTLEAEINPDRTIGETTYADNKKSTTLEVTPPPEVYPICKNTDASYTVVYRWWWYDPCCYHDEDGCSGCWKLAEVPVTYREQFKILSATLSASWRSAYETTDFDIMHQNAKAVAGWPMTLKVVTEYRTDWESKVPQSPCCPPASPFGGTYNGPTEMRVQWPDGKVTILERTDRQVYQEGNWYVERSVWEFPLRDTITDGWQRYVYPDENTREGLYVARLTSNAGGRTGVCDGFDFGVEITGTMYDFLKTHVVQ
ncbi:MAG: hypothetical protein L5656_05410 [Thermanaeromonas sp.]|uniref:hypothetical protein n=1 Tax=Thermanaeromonas sp. TaxID=2003697 RepID=UPI00243DE79B|nr:hypothetical protein [Thermanaeromonas sp.]MCG0277950.1 hypothetical protein [Thermanaeromonas sp.]